jgi:hypothetical protein
MTSSPKTKAGPKDSTRNSVIFDAFIQKQINHAVRQVIFKFTKKIEKLKKTNENLMSEIKSLASKENELCHNLETRDRELSELELRYREIRDSEIRDREIRDRELRDLEQLNRELSEREQRHLHSFEQPDREMRNRKQDNPKLREVKLRNFEKSDLKKRNFEPSILTNQLRVAEKPPLQAKQIRETEKLTIDPNYPKFIPHSSSFGSCSFCQAYMDRTTFDHHINKEVEFPCSYYKYRIQNGQKWCYDCGNCKDKQCECMGCIINRNTIIHLRKNASMKKHRKT